MRRNSTAAIFALGLIVWTGSNCSGQAPEARDGEVETSTTPAELTDAQIAHVAVTANAIDVELARLVESRSTDEAVLSFAETMIGDHSGVNERAASLAERLGVTPEDNAVSRSLREGAEGARESLVALRGDAFDRAYMQREVEYHRAVLEALDGVLIPGASNADLRGLLEQVRPAIAAHLERARGILAAQGD
jgi:putative membrane protein